MKYGKFASERHVEQQCGDWDLIPMQAQVILYADDDVLVANTQER